MTRHINGMMLPSAIIERTGVIAGIAIGGGMLVSGIVSSIGAGKKARKANELAEANLALTEKIANENLALQKEQQKKLDAQKEVYKKMEFKNPYENMENMFENMENTFEDLTVNQQQAQFESQQAAQQRANIMADMQGAAGGSGIASLAQAMANQGQLQAQQASASIGQQERANQMQRAQQAASIQQLQREGARAADLQERGGAASVQAMEMDRQATLLGISMGESAGANAAAMQAQQNQIAAGATQANLMGQQAAAQYQQAGQMFQGVGQIGMMAASDRKLKKNINLIGKSLSGLNIYSFEYKNPIYGQGFFQGVMSNEVPQETVSVVNGYDMVDYSMLDVEFKQI